MNNIINLVNNSASLKSGHIHIPEKGKVWISQIEGSYPIEFNIGIVNEYLKDGYFANIVTVYIEGENGPNGIPARKGIIRLTKILKGTNYRIVQVDGQRFTIEGDN